METQAPTKSPRRKGVINVCGKLNLNSGKNEYFNPLTDSGWVGSATVTLYHGAGNEAHRKDAFYLVGGFGGADERVWLEGSQSQRTLGMFDAVEGFIELPCNAETFHKIKNRVQSNTIKFGTWD